MAYLSFLVAGANKFYTARAKTSPILAQDSGMTLASENTISTNFDFQSKALLVLLLIVLVIVVFSFSFTPLRSDNDAWWHLKSGKYIVEHKALPRTDVFAFTSENIKWDNHEWATQVLFYLTYLVGESSGYGGLRALITLKTFVLIATFCLLFAFANQRSRNFVAAAFFAVIAVAVSRRTIYPRPPIMSYFLFIVFAWILYNVRTGRWKAWTLALLPPLMVVWANFHGGFILGLLLLAFYIVGETVEILWQRYVSRGATALHESRNTIGDFRRLRSFSLGLGGCFVASLVNPYTYNLYVLPLRVMSDKALVNLVPELLPPDYRFTWAYEFMILFLLAGLALKAYRRLILAEMLIILFFLHQSLHHVRHLPLFALASAPLAASLLAHFLQNFPATLNRLGNYLLLLIVLAFSAWSITHHREGESYLDRNIDLLRGTEFVKKNYPVEPCDFIIQNHFTGRMFNQINFAGYLIWRLSPEYHKVFTDSRYDIFGGRFVRDEQIVESGYESPNGAYGWQTVLDKYNINFLLVSNASGLTQRLGNENPSWKLVYYWRYQGPGARPDEYNIYVRNVPENQQLIKHCLDQFEVIKRLKGYEDRYSR
jgi:hypothetical protein